MTGMFILLFYVTGAVIVAFNLGIEWERMRNDDEYDDGDDV